MTLHPMNSSVARSAQRLEVIERIVPLLFGRGNSISVKVVNVQIILCAAALASVIVTLQCLPSITAKTVIVLGFASILFNLVWVCGRPFAYSLDVGIIPARLALSLRSCGVFKRGSTIFARQHVTFARRTNSVSLGSAIFGAFDAMVFFLASITRFLHRACRPIVIGTYTALSDGKSAFGFTVGSKGAGLTSLCVRACSCYLRAAARTINNAVGFHMSHSRMIPNIYSGGAV